MSWSAGGFQITAASGAEWTDCAHVVGEARMTNENRSLSVGIGDWGRNFVSQTPPWVQAMTKDYSSKVHKSIASAMG